MRRSSYRHAFLAVGPLVLWGLAGCKPDLVVNIPSVVWTSDEKQATLVVSNVGTAAAGAFLVYANADENPESRNHRPQVTHQVLGLAKGATVTLPSDFAPLAHPDNAYLGNVFNISALVDPKNTVKESNEHNNSAGMALSFRRACVDFDPPLAMGTQFGGPAGNPPGQVVLVTPEGIKMAVQVFKYIGAGSAFNRARIELPPVAFGSGQVLRSSNINLEFDFAGVGFAVSRVELQYLDLGGFENLAVNGQPVPVFSGELTTVPSPIGNVNVVVTSAPVTGGKTGSVLLLGPINKLTIGGQELWIDSICARE
jgi:hypothetical protein